jgi:hypothetical protein
VTRYGTSVKDSTQCAGEFAKLKSLAGGNDLPLVLAYSWIAYYETLTTAVGAAPIKFTSTDAYADFIFQKLDEVRKELGPRHLIVVGTVPGSGEFGAAVDCLLRPAASRRFCSPQLDISAEMGNSYAFNKNLKSYAERSGAQYIDPYDNFCNQGICQSMIDGKLMYSDRGHLSKDGSIVAAGQILQAVFPDGVPKHAAWAEAQPHRDVRRRD